MCLGNIGLDTIELSRNATYIRIKFEKVDTFCILPVFALGHMASEYVVRSFKNALP